MKKVTSAMFGLSFAASVFAQQQLTAVAEWEAPVEREDGTPLPAEELGGFKLYTVTEGAYDLIETLAANMTVYEGTVPEGKCLTLVVTAFDTNNLESEYSEQATVCAMSPNTPTNFRLKTIGF